MSTDMQETLAKWLRKHGPMCGTFSAVDRRKATELLILLGFTKRDVDDLRTSVRAGLRHWGIQVADDAMPTCEEIAEHDLLAAQVWGIADRLAALLPKE